MDTEHYKQLLLAKEKELLASIARYQADAREAPDAEVQDPIDVVNTLEAKTGLLKENTLEYKTLRQVQDALQRIKDGNYGICIDCGRPIPKARLDAVPWTPYCLEDQEKHDREPVEEDQGWPAA